MQSNAITLVWFKRDLRLHDHAPLAAAAARGAVLPVFVVEPDILRAADADAMHYRFVCECVVELRAQLAALGQPLIVRTGDAVEVFEALRQQVAFDAVYAHQETGNALTYARDRQALAWAQQAGVAWHEWPQHGVVRVLKSRNGWARTWRARMQAPQVQPPARLTALPALSAGALPSAEALGLTDLHPAVGQRSGVQQGGETRGLATLHSFLTERGGDYQRKISAPATAAVAGSRISAYLAWGALSLRRAVQEAENSALPSRAKRAFLSRLHWHCHFMQKLESEPEIETRCFNPCYEQMRAPHDNTQRYLAAWCEGRTGYPFVDACMRSLQATGWLNFRMRAMLVSFAAYNLWLDWRLFRDFLARQFLDYEPGIHMSQLQMQSGVTGINTPRIYNPVKQGLEHDPDGHFVRRWVPELADVPTLFIHQPWKLSAMERLACNLKEADYPAPIVEHLAAIRAAREHIAAIRNSARHREVAGEVFDRHGSRRKARDRATDASYRKRRAKGRDGRRFDQPGVHEKQLSLFE
ncbi:MAG: deoxyribodipyrimidine photo-lyase [Pseudomonadota bacterium]